MNALPGMDQLICSVSRRLMQRHFHQRPRIFLVGGGLRTSSNPGMANDECQGAFDQRRGKERQGRRLGLRFTPTELTRKLFPPESEPAMHQPLRRLPEAPNGSIAGGVPSQRLAMI